VSTYYDDLPLSAINWLSNIVNVLFLPSCLFVPYLSTRLSMRHLMMISAGLTVLAGWLRYASTAHLDGWSRRYVFLILAQALIGLAQPIGLVIGPKYSEAWFDENGRMVATMIVSIGAPLGGAIGQFITPLLAPSPDKVPFCVGTECRLSVLSRRSSSSRSSPPSQAWSSSLSGIDLLPHLVRSCPC
jgi:FLVCR family MFS transporter 7